MRMPQYSNPYYDSDKAHEYYLRVRELKGYEDRYGGHRGFGTSAANDPALFRNLELQKQLQTQSEEPQSTSIDNSSE